MEKLKINVGTYSHCSSCKTSKSCCCDFDCGIDDIVVLTNEKNKIIKRIGKESSKHFKKISDKAYNITNVNGICPFYNNGCTIYDIRPSDCRLFPYDLKEINCKYYLVKYDLPCGSKNINENVDDIINELMPIINIYADKKFNEKVNKLPYIIVKEIKK